jgi:hypothetical protein
LFIISLLFGILFTLGFVGVIVFFRKNEHNIKSRAPSVYSVLEADWNILIYYKKKRESIL